MYIVVKKTSSDGLWPELFVSFNKETDEFAVEYIQTRCGYLVPRGDLVVDHRNFGEVLTQILPDCEDSVLVFIDEDAENEINLIWDANIQLF